MKSLKEVEAALYAVGVHLLRLDLLSKKLDVEGAQVLQQLVDAARLLLDVDLHDVCELQQGRVLWIVREIVESEAESLLREVLADSHDRLARPGVFEDLQHDRLGVENLRNPIEEHPLSEINERGLAPGHGFQSDSQDGIDNDGGSPSQVGDPRGGLSIGAPAIQQLVRYHSLFRVEDGLSGHENVRHV